MLLAEIMSAAPDVPVLITDPPPHDIGLTLLQVWLVGGTVSMLIYLQQQAFWPTVYWFFDWPDPCWYYLKDEEPHYKLKPKKWARDALGFFFWPATLVILAVWYVWTQNRWAKARRKVSDERKC